MALRNVSLDEMEEAVRVINTSTGSNLSHAAEMLTFIVGGKIKQPHPYNQAQAVKAGAIEALMAALSREPAHAAVQTMCVCALGNLCAEQDTHRARAGAAGALPLVVRALIAHRGTPSVAAACCGAIFSLVAHSEANRAAAVRAGAVAGVLDALRDMPAVVEVQAMGLAALFNLAAGDRKSLIAGGGLELAVAALRAHGHNARVAQWAVSAVAQLVAIGPGGPGATDRALAAGAAEEMLRAARLHAADEEVQSELAAFLYAMASVLPSAVRADAVGAVVEAMHAHQSNAELLHVLLRALANLLQGCPTPDRVACLARTAGAVEIIAAEAMRVGDEPDTENLTLASAALFALVEPDAGNALAAVACGVLELLPAVAHALSMQEKVACGILPLHVLLQAAEKLHDSCRCERSERCCRCAAAREAGAMCALPRCGLRVREGGTKLQRCAGCRHAAFCSEVHQRECWPAHRAACKAASAARTEAA
jgi:hypothetical protein